MIVTLIEKLFGSPVGFVRQRFMHPPYMSAFPPWFIEERGFDRYTVLRFLLRPNQALGLGTDEKLRHIGPVFI